MHEYLVHLWSTYEPHPQQKLSAIVHQTWWYTRNGTISIKELPQMSNLSKHKIQIPNYTAPANSSTGMRTSQRVLHCWYCMFIQYKSKTVHTLFVVPHTSTLSWEKQLKLEIKFVWLNYFGWTRRLSFTVCGLPYLHTECEKPSTGMDA